MHLIPSPRGQGHSHADHYFGGEKIAIAWPIDYKLACIHPYWLQTRQTDTDYLRDLMDVYKNVFIMVNTPTL